MRITIVAVGTRMPAWVNEAVADYSKRLPAELNLSLAEVPAARRGKSMAPDKILSRECEAIQARVRHTSHLIILDERGKKLDTRSLAGQLRSWMQAGFDVSLVIGGADGVHAELKKQAAETWSLSDLTLPHGLARVVLVEQLYRAWSLCSGHPYHRD